MVSYRTTISPRIRAARRTLAALLALSASQAVAAPSDHHPTMTTASLNIGVQSIAEGPARSAPVGLAALALLARRRDTPQH